MIHFGILGAGNIAHRFMQGIDCCDHAIVDIVYTRNLEKGKAFIKKHHISCAVDDLEAFLASEVDAVYVATPHQCHASDILKCLEANKHVLCEKAFCQSYYEAKEVVSYIKNERNQRDTSKPFFIMVGMNPPHSPYRSLDDCMEEDFNLYKDQPIDSLLIRPNADKKRAKSESTRYYFASVTGVDRAFGMILDCLKEMGLDKNTIVVFTSDHGETMCSQFTDDPKNSPYAESMNVPFIIRYPGHLRPRVDNLMISTPDIMPTMLGMSNLEKFIPTGIHGHNYAPFFKEENTETVVRPEGALYIQNMDGEKDKDGKVISYFPRSRGIKTHKYTLALYIDRENKLTKTLLFDDEKDPYQLNNLSLDENKQAVEELLALMGKQLKEINDPWYKEQILSDMVKY